MHCPELDELEHYVSGQADAQVRSAIDAHLRACPDCRMRAAEVAENRSMESSLRALLARREGCAAEMIVAATAGRYRIVRELGRGATALVFEALQEDPPRRVALKLLDPVYEARGGEWRLLSREARALARMRHPGIAAIYEAGRTTDGRLFLAMELIEGEPLLSYARRRGLSLAERLRLFCDVCEAVAYAHQRGVIHRDLKPGHILVTPDGRPRVLDFGLARLLEIGDPVGGGRGTITSEVAHLAGTVPYMSPEQAGGSPEIDIRSDVYGLGVVLYELLTGRLPYRVDPSNLLQAARTIADQPPVPPSSILPGLRGDVETVVLKALEKGPERRYPSASDLGADIRRFLRCEPIAARAPGVWYRATRFVRRHRALVVCAAGVALAVVSGSTAAIVQGQAALRERDAAQRRLEYAQTVANYLFAGVGNQIARVPGTALVQRHLAEEAYVFYRRLADEQPDDMGAQVWLWSALRRLASLSLDVGAVERASVLMDQAQARIRQAAVFHPDDPRIPREWMLVHFSLAAIAAARDDAEALRTHARQAATMRDESIARYRAQGTQRGGAPTYAVPEQGPDAGSTPEHLTAAGGWAMGVADELGLELVEADPDLAEAQYLEASRILDELEAVDPTLDSIYRTDLSEYAPLAGPVLLRVGSRPHYQRARARIQEGLGLIALRRGQTDGALDRLRTALELADTLAQQTPDQPMTLALQASVRAHLAQGLLASRDSGAVAHLATEGQQLLGRLMAAEPQSRRWQRQAIALQQLLEDRAPPDPSRASKP